MAEKAVQEGSFQHIVRVANVDIPGEKQIRIALCGIKGVGFNLADAICAVAGVSRITKAGYLKPEDVRKLNDVMQNIGKAGIPNWMFNHRKDVETGEDKHVLTGTLIFIQDNDIKRLKKIKCYRGIRHMKGLPVRGQRTRSNFRRSKGKVVGVTKKKVMPGAASEKTDKKAEKEKK